MSLTSLEFLLFVAITATGYHLLVGKAKRIFLVIASLSFYGMFGLKNIPFLLCVIFLIYAAGFWIQRTTGRKRGKIVALSVAFLILVLGLLKYIKINGPSFIPAALPLGFSFLIFTAISYLIDIKRGRLLAENNFFDFASYLLFFPKIAQGPIERAGDFLPQIKISTKFDDNLAVQGVKRILWGFFKKMVVADRLAIYSAAVFGNIDQHNGTSLAIAVVFYSFRVYADFSGYTDIAVGTAGIFGIKLSENFRRPYFSHTIAEFWSRWHITLSSWLRDYLFLPLAYSLSRKLKKSRYIFVRAEQWIYALATMITFALCGLWHGEGSNFLVWGLIFGIYLTIGRITQKSRKSLVRIIGLTGFPRLYKGLKIIITFMLVSFAWIFFAVPKVSDAGKIINKILTSPGLPFGLTTPNFIYGVMGIGLFMAFEMGDEFRQSRILLFLKRQAAFPYLSYAILVIIILVLGVLNAGQFIYFQF
jgi:alginate O-acetyltransferase complex protein AlgI